jgi:hypothetical protein
MSEPFPGDCFRCRQPGHAADGCHELRPAAGQAEHDARIAAYIQRWETRKWTPRQKQQAISDENKMWYGTKCRAALTL